MKKRSMVLIAVLGAVALSMAAAIALAGSGHAPVLLAKTSEFG